MKKKIDTKTVSNTLTPILVFLILVLNTTNGQIKYSSSTLKSSSNSLPELCFDKDNNMYASIIYDGYYKILKKVDTSWVELGGEGKSTFSKAEKIPQICVDGEGNVYALVVPNNSESNYILNDVIYKWDGNNWNDITTNSLTNYIAENQYYRFHHLYIGADWNIYILSTTREEFQSIVTYSYDNNKSKESYYYVIEKWNGKKWKKEKSVKSMVLENDICPIRMLVNEDSKIDIYKSELSMIERKVEYHNSVDDYGSRSLFVPHIKLSSQKADSKLSTVFEYDLNSDIKNVLISNLIIDKLDSVYVKLYVFGNHTAHQEKLTKWNGSMLVEQEDVQNVLYGFDNKAYGFVSKGIIKIWDGEKYVIHKIPIFDENIPVKLVIDTKGNLVYGYYDKAVSGFKIGVFNLSNN